MCPSFKYHKMLVLEYSFFKNYDIYHSHIDFSFISHLFQNLTHNLISYNTNNKDFFYLFTVFLVNDEIFTFFKSLTEGILNPNNFLYTLN